MQVKRLTETDFAGWRKIIAEGDAQHHDALPHLIKPAMECHRTQADFQSVISDPEQCLIGIAAGDSLAGFLHGKIMHKPDGQIHRAQKIAKIHEIVVGRDYPRQGLGTMLLTEFQNWAHAMNADAVELSVYNFNQPAVAFYEKFGFSMLSHTMRLELKS